MLRRASGPFSSLSVYTIPKILAFPPGCPKSPFPSFALEFFVYSLTRALSSSLLSVACYVSCGRKCWLHLESIMGVLMS